MNYLRNGVLLCVGPHNYLPQETGEYASVTLSILLPPHKIIEIIRCHELACSFLDFISFSSRVGSLIKKKKYPASLQIRD